jgi:hypothetical protein
MSSLGGMAAVAGIGQTEFSKESGRSELQLACEAVKAAIDDAGLRPSEVDGMVTFTMDSSDEIEITRNVGIGDLTFFTRVHHGGGAAAGTVVQAAMAVATGTADAVVCYRAFNERSGLRFGGATARPTGETPLFMANYAPFGLLTPAAWVACTPSGTCRATGSPTRISAGSRSSTAPMRRGIRRVVLRTTDHARGPSELAVGHRTRATAARLLPGKRWRRRGGHHSAERARDSPTPAVITARYRGGRRGRDDDELLPRRHHRSTGDGRGRQLWRDSGISPPTSDPFLYDHFTPFVFAQLEELGFCGRGEAKDFATVERLSLGGELPINTNGGLLGEAYIHGMNGITEGVRQVRGTSCNQADDVEHVLVTSGTGVPTSALILAPAD